MHISFRLHGNFTLCEYVHVHACRLHDVYIYMCMYLHMHVRHQLLRIGKNSGQATYSTAP